MKIRAELQACRERGILCEFCVNFVGLQKGRQQNSHKIGTKWPFCAIFVDFQSGGVRQDLDCVTAANLGFLHDVILFCVNFV